MQYIPLLILSCFIALSSSAEPSLGDPCVCTNSGAKGIYLPNPAKNDQLECNCHNFSLLPDEFALVFTERLHSNPAIITRIEAALKNERLTAEQRNTIRTIWILSCELYQRRHTTYPSHIANRESTVLKKYNTNFRTPRERTKFLKYIATAEPLIYVQEQAIKLTQSLGLPWNPNVEQLSKALGDLLQKNMPLIQDDALIRLHDGCTMIGADCSCSNTRQPGVCSINAEQKDAKGRPICWRCRELSCNCH